MYLNPRRIGLCYILIFSDLSKIDDPQFGHEGDP